VKINRGNNYGTLSPFYLFKFVNTTDELIHISGAFDRDEFYKTYIKLESKELIIYVDDRMQIPILNKEKWQQL